MTKNIEERFLKDVEGFEMIINCDNGVNRSILFKHPEKIYNNFTLTTWHGCLCIEGDMGAYVFERVHDMFEFFKIDRSDFNYSKSKKLNINPAYWAEKVIAEDKQNKVEKYSYKKFEAYLEECFKDFCSGNEEEISKEDESTYLENIKEDFSEDLSEEEIRKMVSDKSWLRYDCGQVEEDFAEYIGQDFWEVDLNDYTEHYLWCLYAIVWGIQKYEEYKERKNN